MSKQHKIMLIFLVVMLALALVASGCSKPAEQPPATEGEGEQQAEVIKVRFGINQDPGTPQYNSSMAFAEKVAELSNGQLEVTVYPSMQLGGLNEQAEMVQTGTLEMSKQPASVWSNLSAAFEAYDIPFLFKNEDAMYEVCNGPVGQEIADTLKEKGVVGLGYSTGGLKQMTANKPIHTPDDLVGLKFRVMPAPILVKTYEAFGANPTPVDFGELYNALQQGVVDGQENPLQTVDMMKLWEVQDHLSLTNNGPMLYMVGANQQWFESLSPDLQQNIIDAFKYALDQEWEENKAAEAGWLENAKNGGMTVYTPTEADLEAFKAKIGPVIDYVKGNVDPGLVDRLVAAAEEANSKH